MASTSSPTLARLMLLACLFGSGCDDAAVDGDYVGEALHVIEGTVAIAPGQAPLALEELAGPVRIAVLWGTDGQAETGTLAAPVEGHFPARFVLRIVAPPPESALRVARVGRFAIGQIVLFVDANRSGTFEHGDAGDSRDRILGTAERTMILFSPEGASDPMLAEDVAAGFHRVDPTAPCMHAAVRFMPRPVAAVGIDAFTGIDEPELFTSAGCAGRIIAAHRQCESLWQIRFICRAADPANEVCDRCERYLFPEGQPELCDAWYQHCLGAFGPAASSRPCDEELPACRVGELARAEPCDLACACERYDVGCAATSDAATCIAKNEGCDWR